MSENITGKYLKYAIGEVVLVVIGILIALSINNWNEKRLELDKIQFYYQRLVEELELQIEYSTSMIESNTDMVNMQKRTLEILITKNLHDIPELQKNIGSVAIIGGTSYTMDIFNEFVMLGLMAKVKNTKLKESFHNLKMRLDYAVLMEEQNLNQYSTLIEPFFSKHINLSQVELEQRKSTMLNGGPETEFKTLFNSMEAWNVINSKLKTTNARVRRLANMLKVMETLKVNLIEELNNK